jgi:GT2 family glycosyltransferase
VKESVSPAADSSRRATGRLGNFKGPEPLSSNQVSIAPEPAITRVAVIILTMNQRDTTLRCLGSFSDVKRTRHQILVWDNGSVDDTAEAIGRKFPDVAVHRHHQNLGVASGRNAAATIADEEFHPDYLLFLDNDTTVTAEFLHSLAAPFEQNPELALTTAKIRDMSDPRRLYGAGGCRCRFWLGDTRHVGYGEVDRGQYDQSKSCLPSGGCMLVRNDVFHELGGFDTAFDPYGPEDLDFGLRAFKAGYRALYVPRSIIFHASRPGRTLDKGTYSREFAASRARHWFLLMRRHASRLQKMGFFLLGAPCLLVALGVREARRGNLLPALRGLIQGIVSFVKLSGNVHAGR